MTQPSEFVDSESSLISLLDKLSNLSANHSRLFIDLEGINLSRHGTISIMQLFSPPLHSVYLIDIFTLRDQAFNTSGTNGQTMKQILEAPNIPKIFFDVRKDSDALFAHYGIRLDGVQDLQLMELATRTFNRRHLNGLAKCIQRDAGLPAQESANWEAVKLNGKGLFDPQRGGRYEVFNARPLSEEMRAYCVQDVLHMPTLYNVYSARLTHDWATKVNTETEARINLAMNPSFNGDGRHMALGPW